ncbi:MAG: hypothetical protein AB7G75_26245 [Candidatus Binatia bacterium]
MQHTIAGATAHRESFPAWIKVGKVIGVHRDDNSVDVAFLDGALARHVPVLPAWLGSAFGIVGLTAPTYDREVLAKKTYPHAPSGTVQPSQNPSGVGRDQYVVVLQLEGHGFGTVGGVVIGFFAAQVSEMLFLPGEEGGEADAYSDMLLLRHSSDVQTTIDKAAKVNAEAPCGTRITIGTGGVDLTKKDYDKLYELRHNTTAWKDIEAIVTGPAGGGHEVKAHLQLQVGERADLFARTNILAHTPETTYVDLTEANSGESGTIEIFAKDTITIRNGAGTEIKIDGANITIHAPGEVDVEGAVIRLN